METESELFRPRVALAAPGGASDVGPMSPARPGETVDLATRRAAAVAMSPRAVWKAIEPKSTARRR